MLILRIFLTSFKGRRESQGMWNVHQSVTCVQFYSRRNAKSQLNDPYHPQTSAENTVFVPRLGRDSGDFGINQHALEDPTLWKSLTHRPEFN
jgi:hypothetical protein